VKFEPVKVVHVYYKPKSEEILLGRLALKSRRIFFEYDSDFIALGLNLSPFKLPLKPGVIPSSDFVFDGLFGIFNDSLPDGWGRLLLDRKLIKYNLNPGLLSPLDRLCFVGKHGMGALTYEPETEETLDIPHIDLDVIANEVREFQENDDDRFVEDLLKLGGSSAGARPKVLLSLHNDNWIIKFRSSTDPKDIGAIEYAYHLMATEAGLDVPEAKLFPSRKGQGFFGTKRFDKLQDESIHMHTISGLLHADHRIPSLDYETIMKATMHLTHDIRECEKQFRNCIFNVLSHNRDDHAKNFSFLMDRDGIWRVSPAYDQTFSSGPGGEHCSMIMGEGKNPGVSHLLELAKTCNIKKAQALEIINEVKSVLSKWTFFAGEVGVSSNSTKMIGSVIKKIIKEV
jgi:serine/threonine-protein kinase HipA